MAYYDSTPGNSGNQYRTGIGQDVDIETTSNDVTNGPTIGPGGSTGYYNVGFITAGEWLKYTVTVPNDGDGYYNVNFRTSAGGSGGTLELLDTNGTSLTGPVPFRELVDTKLGRLPLRQMLFTLPQALMCWNCLRTLLALM